MWATSAASKAAALQAGVDAADAMAASTCTTFPPPPLSLAAAYGPDSTVLLTGGCGYIGSVVLEHLLRCTPCPRIVCLVRSKRGTPPSTRMDCMLARPLFRALHGSDGTLPQATRDRVVTVDGDLQHPGLGLSGSASSDLAASLTHAIHCAASISFTDTVGALLASNYDATAAVLAFARSAPNLAAFVHVSTAYVNGHFPPGSVVGEALHDLAVPGGGGGGVDHADLAARLRCASPKEADALTASILASSGLPNAYCLTKHMAERLVADAATVSPFGVSIVRPSIVGALSQHSAAPGYVGNTAGFTSVYLSVAVGLYLHTCHRPQSVFDLVPGDVVASVVVASGADAACGGGRNTPRIFHACSSTSNPITMAELIALYVHRFALVRLAGIWTGWKGWGGLPCASPPVCSPTPTTPHTTPHHTHTTPHTPNKQRNAGQQTAHRVHAALPVCRPGPLRPPPLPGADIPGVQSVRRPNVRQVSGHPGRPQPGPALPPCGGRV